MADDVKQRLAILDELAGLFFSMHESDSASDFKEKLWRALDVLEPLLEKREMRAPCDGTVSGVEAYKNQTISRWMKHDPLFTVGGQDVSAGSMGQIREVLVKDGDEVKAGQALAILGAYRGTADGS